MEQIYLDSNSTSRPAAEVVDAMEEMLRSDWGNPSSSHRFGQRARRRLAFARESVCRLVGCSDRELLFTSGGTEAAALALLGSLQAQPKRDLLVTARVEHSAVRELAERLEQGRGECGPLNRDIEVRWIDTDGHGVVDVEALRGLLAEQGERIALVSLMWVNNETGVIQPLEQIGQACRSAGVRFHTDATQAVGKLPCDFQNTTIDLLSCSAHK
ncbi:MAG: cysteine desulfurase family protein, partial [Planctomycetota bacterium]